MAFIRRCCTHSQVWKVSSFISVIMNSQVAPVTHKPVEGERMTKDAGSKTEKEDRDLPVRKRFIQRAHTRTQKLSYSDGYNRMDCLT